MIDECLMTEDCPGYDPDLQRCLIRPGDCEFRPTDRDADLTFEKLEGVLLDASAEAGSR